MKLVIIFFSFLILLATFQVGSAQEKSKAKLIFEFGKTGGCEHYWSAIDYLLQELVDESSSVGYIVLHGNKDDVIQTITYKEWVSGHLRLRKLDPKLKNFDVNRIKVIRGEDSPELKVQIWKVTIGETIPFNYIKDFDYALNIKKPTVFYDNNFDAGGLCPYFDSLKVFAEFLQANPEMKGNVVVYKNKSRSFKKAKNEILNSLQGISQNRLRFIYSTNVYEGDYELWFVPNKKQ